MGNYIPFVQTTIQKHQATPCAELLELYFMKRIFEYVKITSLFD